MKNLTSGQKERSMGELLLRGKVRNLRNLHPARRPVSMNMKSPFVLASLLMGHLPFFQTSANEQTRNEVRQALLSIQAELNEMEGRKSKAPPAPKAPLASPPEPYPAPEPFPPTQPTPEPEPPIDFPSEPQTGQAPVPAFLSRKQEVARELQSVQEGLDQLNRQSGRFPAGQVSSANPSEVAPPEPPVVPEQTPWASPPRRTGSPASFNRSKPPSTK